MARHVLISIMCALYFIGAVALAQTQAPAPAPAPIPDVMPFDIPYGTPISLERAKQVGDAAVAEARKRNWKMAIAIAEPTGDIVYFQKMDGTQYASIRISQGKARAAATFRRPTKIFFDAMETGHPYVATLEGVVGSEGGVPIVENGKLIGSIGVSGGTGAQDGVVARAGADTVK
jgi:glc operon protein GlcG